MQIDLIDTFLDLMETASFNRTAERLGVKQSTVSARIQALEAQLGAALFDRSRAGTRATAAGATFLPHARALRHEWNEARRSLTGGAAEGQRLRIGVQSDLATFHAGAWLEAFLAALPEARFYVEADFSAQMSADVLSGAHDLAVLYTPQPHPDLHIERLGDVSYRMVSTEADRLGALDMGRLILGNYAPAFSAMQRDLLGPVVPRVASGMTAAVESLLLHLGGSAFILEAAARQMAAAGTAVLVSDVPPILQPVYAVLHVRRRHVATQRRLLSVLRGQFRRSRASD